MTGLLWILAGLFLFWAIMKPMRCPKCGGTDLRETRNGKAFYCRNCGERML